MIAPRLVIAGTQSGVGKTTVTVAILAALKNRGRLAQSFGEAGPYSLAGRCGKLNCWLPAVACDVHVYISD